MKRLQIVCDTDGCGAVVSTDGEVVSADVLHVRMVWHPFMSACPNVTVIGPHDIPYLFGRLRVLTMPRRTPGTDTMVEEHDFCCAQCLSRWLLDRERVQAAGDEPAWQKKVGQTRVLAITTAGSVRFVQKLAQGYRLTNRLNEATRFKSKVAARQAAPLHAGIEFLTVIETMPED